MPMSEEGIRAPEMELQMVVNLRANARNLIQEEQPPSHLSSPFVLLSNLRQSLTDSLELALNLLCGPDKPQA